MKSVHFPGVHLHLASPASAVSIEGATAFSLNTAIPQGLFPRPPSARFYFSKIFFTIPMTSTQVSV